MRRIAQDGRGVKAPQLSASDRHLLLIASLSLYLRRLRHGIAVTREDLTRLATYGDEPREARNIGAAA